MMRMKSVPRHIRPGVKTKYSLIKPLLSTHKGSHSVDKYNPHLYLSKRELLKTEVKKNELLFYEYKIHIKPLLPAIKTSNGSAQLSLKQPETCGLSKYEVSKDYLLHQENSIEFLEKLTLPRGMGHKLGATGEQSENLLSAKTELDSPERSDNSAFPSLSQLGKEKLRRKWRKLTKRTIFNFDLDVGSNTVSLVRVKQVGVEDDFDGRVKERVKAEGQSLSSHIQKKKGVEDRAHVDSVKVYYELASVPPSKTLGLAEAAVEKNARKLILRNKLASNLKTEHKLKRMLLHKSSELKFDLNNLKIEELDAADLFRLYLAMKRAVAPAFHGTGSEELNSLDPEILEVMRHRASDELGLSDYDVEIVGEYKKHMDQVEDGSMPSGFWRLCKVRGHRPTCRESGTLELVGDKLYLFGGYGVDRMNDLWYLSAENPDVEGCVWTLVRPLGTAVPERRYGHCMASYRSGVYVFGGSSDFIAGLKTRVVLDDMWKYSIEDNQWWKIETSRYKFKSSMYAASCVFEGLWFIHGGTDGNGSTLSSSIAYLFGTFHAQD